MSLKISTHLGHKISSQMLNDRVTDVLGGNALISGFEVLKKSNDSYTRGPGKCIINGAIIEETSNTAQGMIGSALLVNPVLLYTMKYFHQSKQIASYIKEPHNLEDNELLLATIYTEDGAISKIVQAPHIMLMSEINDVAEKVESVWDNKSADLEVSEKHIMAQDTMRGQVENIKLYGQTYQNLITDDNIERNLIGELVTDDAFSHKLNSQDGAVSVDVKGRALQNIVRSYSPNKFGLLNSEILSNGYFKIKHSPNINQSYARVIFGNHIYKPSTQYTVFVNIIENTADTKLGMSAIFSPIKSSTVSSRDFLNKTGVSAISFTTLPSFDKDDAGRDISLDIYIGIWQDGGDLSKHITFKYWVLEGNHLNTPIEQIPFIEGIEGVGDKSKNIISNSMFEQGRVVSGIGKSYEQNKEDSPVRIRLINLLPVKKDRTYTVSCASGFKFAIQRYKDNVSLSDSGWVTKLTIDSGDCTHFSVPISKQDDANIYVGDAIAANIQIEEGTTATHYEPYYEGYKVETISCGKNLFNNRWISGSISQSTGLEYSSSTEVRTEKPIRVYAGQALVFSNNGVLRGTNTFFYDRCMNFLSCLKASSRVTIPAGAVYMKLMGNPDNRDKFQIEESDIVTSYESYQESKIEYQLSEPLMSLPNGVYDEIIGNKIVRRTGRITLDGSESWAIRDHNDSAYSIFALSSSDGKVPFYYNNITSLGKEILLCDRLATRRVVSGLIEIQGEAKEQITVICNDVKTYGVYITLPKSKLQTADIVGFKAWLAQNPLEVYYEREAELIIPIDSKTLPNGVTDKIIDADFVERVIRKLTVNGGEEWVYHSTNSAGIANFFTHIDTPTSASICDKLSYGPIIAQATSKCFHISSPDQRLYVRIESSIAGNISAFKAWLASNPLTFWYESRNKYRERLTPAKPLLTFEGNTNIVCPNIVAPKLKVNSKGTRYSTPLLEPNTKYTVKSNIDAHVNLGGERLNIQGGVTSITTPAVLTEKALYLSGWSSSKLSDITVVKGDAKHDGYIKGIESVGDIDSPVLPNGVRDELIGGDQMIQRVGKVIIDGSEPWKVNQWPVQNDTLGLEIDFANNIPNNTDLGALCDRFIVKPFNIISSTNDIECIAFSNTYGVLGIRILKSRLSSPDLAGFKKWVSENPITVWYELTEPEEKTCFNFKVDVKSCSKNLVDTDRGLLINASYCAISNDVIEIESSRAWGHMQIPLDLKPNTRYCLSGEFVRVTGNGVSYIQVQDKVSGLAFNNGFGMFTTPSYLSNRIVLNLCCSNGTTPSSPTKTIFRNIMIEEGEIQTPYERYSSSKITHKLAEPLRSLPDGTCDEIVGDTVIRRVGRVNLKGNENWFASPNQTENTIAFQSGKILMATNPFNVLSNNFQNKGIGAWDIGDFENIAVGKIGLYGIDIRIFKSRLDSLDAEGFGKWISRNPTAVYYQRVAPVITPLDSIVLPNSVSDTISGSTITRRLGKAVLDGSEEWGVSQINTKTSSFMLPCPDAKISDEISIISDRFEPMTSDEMISNGRNDNEGISLNKIESRIYIRITNAKIGGPPVVGDASKIKAWLSKNPVTVYYELKTPYEEKAPQSVKTLQSYEGITMVLATTNVKPTINASFLASIKRIVRQNTKRITELDNLIDSVILPGLIDTDYRNMMFGFDYNMDKLLNG